jgi:hypothetical protein
MDAIDFFVLHHGRLHMQVERGFLHGLSDAQMRLRPEGLTSIAWLVWHMARSVDSCASVLSSRLRHELALELREDEWHDRRMERTTDSTIRAISGHTRMVKAFSVWYACQRVGQDQPAVQGAGDPLMVVNGRWRTSG